MIPHLSVDGDRRLLAMPAPSTPPLTPGNGHVIVCGVEDLGLRTIDDLPPRPPVSRRGVAIDPSAAVSAVRPGVGKVLGSLPPPLGVRRPASPAPIEPEEPA
jgi:hypothetical protein